MGKTQRQSVELSPPTNRSSLLKYTSTIYCDTGYLLEGSVYTTASIICEHLAREDKYVWKGNQIYQCIVGVCKVPSQMANGKVSVGSTLVGAKALFGCNDGFNLVGLFTSICVLHSGIGTFWNNPMPSCEVVDCGPFKMTNAEYTDPYLTTYLSEVGYKCIPGFHAEGAETAKAVCHKTGNWSYYPCTALACSVEEIVDAGYGVVKKSPMKYIAKCNSTGYEVSLTCLYNNSWSLQLPLCSSGTGAVSAANLDSNNLIVIGVCVTLTLLVVFVIILVSIIMLKR
ncbi:cd55 [Bugula neritina]|uniref:Cd55 n=1 Tax=Bugula neritina TaxID=10212 RepID=A0A7J7JZ71_BUGNE|nr:cd55 [Bugula neritina]